MAPALKPRKLSRRGTPTLDEHPPWVDVLELYASLRHAADRAKRTPDYKPRNTTSRTVWAAGLSGLAQKLYKRRLQGLPVGWHMDKAREMLRQSP